MQTHARVLNKYPTSSAMHTYLHNTTPARMSTNLNTPFNCLTNAIAVLHLSVGIRTMCATTLISKRHGRGAAAPHRNCNQRVQQVNVTMRTAISNAQSNVTIAESSMGYANAQRIPITNKHVVIRKRRPLCDLHMNHVSTHLIRK